MSVVPLPYGILPGRFLNWFLNDWFLTYLFYYCVGRLGRRLTFSLLMFLAAVSLVILPFVEKGKCWFRLSDLLLRMELSK